jgi:hypothetical protein
VTKGPLNYTTQIDPGKTAGECIGMLARHGADAIGMTYTDKKPAGLTFRIETAHGPRQFSLPVNTEGVFNALVKSNRRGDIAPRFASREHAERVAWRVVRDWLEVQLALVEAGVAELDQAMLAFVHVAPGVTMFEAYRQNEHAALTAGDGER